MALNPVSLIGKHTVVNGNRLFEPLNDLTIVLAAIAHASSFLRGRSTHTEAKPVMRINARLLGHAFAIPLRGPLEVVLNDTTPTKIEIGIVPLARQDQPLEGTVVASTTGLGNALHHIVSSIFLSFFERYNVWLRTNVGEAVNWPMTLNFARIVRNAIAHGMIDIRNQNSPPVTWHGLSYSYVDRGKEIIGIDLRIGEILGLMFEVNEELDRLGVPTL